MDVNAEVERVVIPIGVMFAAPVAFSIEAVDIAIDLPAIGAETSRVAIDSFFGMAEAFVALVAPAVVAVMVVVVLGAGGAAKGKRERDGKHRREDDPQMMFGHGFVHGIPPCTMELRSRRMGQSDTTVIWLPGIAVRIWFKAFTRGAKGL
jgi:hypothetical protein